VFLHEIDSNHKILRLNAVKVCCVFEKDSSLCTVAVVLDTVSMQLLHVVRSCLFEKKNYFENKVILLLKKNCVALMSVLTLVFAKQSKSKLLFL